MKATYLLLVSRASTKAIHGAFFVLAFLALGLGATPAAAGLFDQDALITQNNLGYVYFQSEWFDTSSSNSATPPGTFDSTMWNVNFASPANASGPTIIAPTQNPNTTNPNNAVVTYSLKFTDPGLYSLYTFRVGGNGDSMFVPPAINGNPTTTDRWNSLADNAWNELNAGSDAPAASFFTTGAGTRRYEITAAQVGTPVELRIGAREAGAQYDRFVLHKTAGLTGGALDALTFSNVVINNQAAEPVFTFNPPASAPTGGLGTMGIREVTANGAIGDQTQAQTSLTSGTGTIVNYTAPTLNILDSDGDGRFSGNSLFRSDSDQVGLATDTVNDISLLAQGKVRVPAGQAGAYTFGVNSDDGFTLIFPGKNFTSATNAALPLYQQGRAIQFFGGRGVADSLGVINLPEGDHPFILTFHEGGGGSAVELFAAKGAKTGFDPSFKLVGGSAGTAQKKLVTVSQWQLTEVYNEGGAAATLATTVNNVRAFWNNGNAVPAGNTATFFNSFPATINFVDPQNPNSGSHGADAVAFPGNLPADDDNYGAGARAGLTIGPGDGGTYTFMVFSDDPNRFRILDSSNNPVPVASVSAANSYGTGDIVPTSFGTDACCTDYFGQFVLAEGSYTMEAFFHEIGGGAGFLLYGAKGAFTSYDPDTFQLIGSNINAIVPTAAGLQLVPEPSSLILAGLGALGLFGLARRTVTKPNRQKF